MSYNNNSYWDAEKQNPIPVAGQELGSSSYVPSYENNKNQSESSAPQASTSAPQPYVATTLAAEQYVPQGDTYVEGVGFDDNNRNQFLYKVVITVCLQMCVAGGIIWWLLTDFNSLCYVQTETWVFWVGLFAAPILCAITFCIKPLVHTSPLNILTLVVWTFLFSFFIAMIATVWVFSDSECYCTDNTLTHAYCVDDALGVIAPAAFGTGVIFASTVIITLCGFDIIKNFKIFLIIYFVLSWPLGFFGLIFLPLDAYWCILCVFVIYAGTVGILVTLRLIVSNKYDFSPDEWVRASMYIYMQIGRIFIYLLAIIGGSD